MEEKTVWKGAAEQEKLQSLEDYQPKYIQEFGTEPQDANCSWSLSF